MADEEKTVDPRVAAARAKAEAARQGRAETPEERERRLAELKKQAAAKKAATGRAAAGAPAPPAAPAAQAPLQGSGPGAPAWKAAPQTTVQITSTRIPPSEAAEAPAATPELSRRSFLRVGFWSGMGLAAAAGAVTFLRFFWPTKVTGFGSVVRVSPDRIPEPGGEPVRISEGKFWLVNLAPGEGGAGGFAQASETGGLLALYWKCPHLGCTVPWRGGFEFEGQRGWFRCPCHGSTYNKAGVRVYGPAPRPMDTMAITVNDDGSLSVDTGEITPGDADNPQRAVSL